VPAAVEVQVVVEVWEEEQAVVEEQVVAAVGREWVSCDPRC